MMRALWTGISGLKNHQIGLDVVANNIANINTIGFKEGRAVFTDILSQTMQAASEPQDGHGGSNPEQIGLGMRVASVDTIMTKGNIQVTNKNTDTAIDGQGFYMLDGGVIGGKSHFTRNGDFSLDADGHLINGATGYYVQGWQSKIDKSNGNTYIDNSQPLTNVTITPGDSMEAKATQNIKLVGNLNNDIPKRLQDITLTFNKDTDGNGTSDATYKVDVVFTKASPTKNYYIWRVFKHGANRNNLGDPYADVLREPPAAPGDTGKLLTGILQLDANGNVVHNFENLDYKDVADWNGDGTISANENQKLKLHGAWDDGNTATTADEIDDLKPNDDLLLTDRELQMLTNPEKWGMVQTDLNWQTSVSAMQGKNVFVFDADPTDNAPDATADVAVEFPEIGSANPTVTFSPDITDTYDDYGAQSGDAQTAVMNNDADVTTGSSTTVYDSLGDSYNLYVKFEKISAMRWMWWTQNPLDPTKASGFGQISFDDKGNILPSYTKTYQSPSDVATNDSFSDVWNYGDSNLTDGKVIYPGADISVSGVRATEGGGTNAGPDGILGTADDITVNGVDDPLTDVNGNNKYDDTTTASKILDYNTRGFQGIEFDPAFYGGSPELPRTADTVKIGIDLSRMTQMAGESNVDVDRQDGHPMGVLQTFSFDQDGVVQGIYSNGFHKPLAQLAVVLFNNPGGLMREGDTMFTTSANSGIPKIGVARKGGRGKIYPGAVEMSNVDLAEEFTNMIVMQRGFEANAKTITTADQMLQDIINLKR